MRNTTLYYKPLYLKVCFLFLLSISVCIHVEANTKQSLETRNSDVFDLIMSRIQSAHKNTNVSTVDTNVDYYLSVLNDNGAFPDINYADRSQTNWNPVGHLDRLKPIVLAYTMPNSKHYGSEQVYNTIVKMLDYWYNVHPTSTNWYMQQIACPQRMGVMLILMRSGAKALPQALETKLIERMRTEGGRPDQSGSQGTGANKLDIATHWIYRGCLVKDTSVLSFGVDQAYYPVFITTGEGLQQDFSYHQHNNQLYVGGYGHVFVDGITNLALYLVETPYALSGEKLDLMGNFMRKIYLPIIRSKYFMYNVLGRGISRKNGISQGGFAGIVNRMIALDPANAQTYQDAVDRLRNGFPAGHGLKPTNTHFWRSDYTLHQRPEFSMDVRMASKYVCRNENGNGENLKGYFLTDGATDIATKGDEYLDIFPVWDWAKIPGVTAPAMTSIPKPGEWGKLGNSPFAGGASDGVYGVTSYWQSDYTYSVNTTARKSWFFFDNEVICLGVGIQSSATQSISTTVNQCLLRGDVMTMAGGASTVLSNGSRNYKDLEWLLHDGIAYYFPQGGNITVSNQPQTGTWKSINSSYTDELVTKDVLKVWFDHGVAPKNGSYEYWVVPNKNTMDEVKAYSTKQVQILANTDSMQIVRHIGHDIISAVFYRAASYTDGEIYIKSDKACTVLFRDINTSAVKMYIADPSRQQSLISLITQFPNIEGKKETKCLFKVYPDAYAGSSYEYLIDKNTPEFVEVKYQYNYAVEDAWVRDGAYANTNYGNTNTLIVKKDGEGYARETYIKFDLKQIDLRKYEKISLALDVSNSNISIHDTQWNIGYVSDDNWSENTLTWKNKPVVNNILATISTVSAGSSVMVDLTQLVRDEINSGNGVLTLNISSTSRGTDGKTDAQFYSKESSDVSKSPRLIMLESKSPTDAESFTFDVTEDAWTRDGSYSNINYGQHNMLTVKKDGTGYNRESYLKFDLQNTDFESLEKVALKLVVANANSSIQNILWYINPVSNNWTESTLTWQNAPGKLENAIASMYGAPAGTEVLFDVTDYVRREYESGNKVISLQVMGSLGVDGKTDAQFHSKETSDAMKVPKLIINAVQKTKVASKNVLDRTEGTDYLIYPNPVDRGSSVYITIPENVCAFEVKVYNLFGRLQLTTQGPLLDTSNLLQGMYMVMIYDTGNKKLVHSTRLLVK